MKLKVITGIILTLLLTSMLTLAFNIQPGKSKPTTITVPDDYSTIQEAINSTQSGDMIFVHTGTYYEHVIIDKSISLIGEDKHNTIIYGNLTGHVINVTANDVKIAGFTIRRSYGIYLGKYSTNNNISCNIINECKIVLDGSSNNIISRNNITNSEYGIILSHASDNIISLNNIENGDNCGIVLREHLSSRNLILQNNITNNGGGIELWDDGGKNTISGNNIMNNTGWGIRLSDSEDNIFYDNNVINNEYGVAEFYTSSNNVFHHNNFIDNTYQVDYQMEGRNIWDNGYLSGGNHWSDYTGVDERSGPYQDRHGSDGIGDTPYVIDSYNKDRYPLMSSWTPTPPTPYIIRVPMDLPTIQEAIDVAGIGYTIFVYKGTYYEHLRITKPLLLIGENPATTIIDGRGEGKVISIGANDVVIQNFTIRNSGPNYSDAGISIDNPGYLYYGSALIIGNVITKNGGWGIKFYYSSNNTVLENNITNNTNGIILYSSSNNTISRNNITNNQQGGVQFSESRDNSVSENDIEKNGDFGVGFFTTSTENNIYENNLENNKYGIYIKQASHNKICHNNFINNINQAHIEPTQFVEYVSANTWDNGYPSGGNYWSDYAGIDADHDGIGDTPYVIDENNQDNYPLMRGLEEFPEEEVPFWMQWWFYAIVAAVIVALVGVVYFLKKRKSPIAPTPPSEGTLQNTTQNSISHNFTVERRIE